MSERTPVSRRAFVQWSAAVSAAVAAGGGGAAHTARAAEATTSNDSRAPVHALGADRHLFIDDWLTETKSNVALTVNPPENRQLVLIADKPWERNGISNYCNV